MDVSCDQKRGEKRKGRKKKPGKFHTRQAGRPTQCVSLRYSRERERKRDRLLLLLLVNVIEIV